MLPAVTTTFTQQTFTQHIPLICHSDVMIVLLNFMITITPVLKDELSPEYSAYLQTEKFFTTTWKPSSYNFWTTTLSVATYSLMKTKIEVLKMDLNNKQVAIVMMTTDSITAEYRSTDQLIILPGGNHIYHHLIGLHGSFCPHESSPFPKWHLDHFSFFCRHTTNTDIQAMM